MAPCRRGPTDKAPDYESGGCRFDSCRRRHLAVAQRSRAPPSEGGGRTFESCRRGRANRSGPCSSGGERVPGTDEVVGANPTEGPTEAIRPDEEPVPNTGRGRSPWAFESPRFRHVPTPRWSRGQDTGPSTRRPGFDSPSRYSHTPTQMPEETKRSRARRAGRRSGVDSARWSSGKTSGCYPEGGGSSPSLAAHDDQRSVAEEFRRVAANHETGVRIPPGRPSQHRTPVVVVQRRGCRYATSVMRVRVPPTTRNNDRSNTDHRERGRACPPTSTTS